MPSFKNQASVLAAALAVAPALVSAHGHVTAVTIKGKEFPGFQPGNPSPDSVGWSTTVEDNGFVGIAALNDDDIICHRGASNAASAAPVAAGDTITIQWDTWPESHHGPVIDYLASCGDGDCSKVEKTSLEFFKFNEGGLNDGSSAPGQWASDDLIQDGFAWSTTIPKDLAPGNYVLRHEIIALHEGAQAGKGAQMYPHCINIEVTGSGSKLPDGVAGTALYSASEKGINFDIYKVNDDYPIPGPALAFSSSGGDSAPAPAPKPSTPSNGDNSPAPSATSAAPTTLVTATSTAGSTASSAPSQPSSCGASVGAQAMYLQCGGQEYTGSTTCVSGTTCKKLNDYYSQCLPESN